MGIIVTKNDEDTKLNERISADLRNRAQATSDISDPDLAEDTEYTKELKKTGRFSWVWIVLVVLAIASLIFILFL